MFCGNLEQQKEFLYALNEMEAKSENHWDMLALYWERRRIQCIFSVLENLLSKNGQVRVLDVGSGDGVVLSFLEQKGAHPVGIDLSFTRLSRSSAHCGAQHVQAEATCLPFSDRTFDVVVCTDVLEHLADMEQAVTELSRICTEPGCILVSVPCCNLYRLMTRKYRYISPYTHLREFSYFNTSDFESIHRLTGLFGKRGFNLIKRRGTCTFSIDFYQNHNSQFIHVIDRILSFLNMKGLYLYEVLLFGRN